MVRIKVSVWFPVAMCVLYHALPARGFVAFLLAVVFHETGHILCIFYTGARVTSLALCFGGVVLDTSPLTYRQEMICSLGGPVCSLLLLLFRRRFPWLGFWGLVQGLYNLIPVYRLDGGRCLRALLGSRLSLGRASGISRAVSWAVLVLGAGFCLLMYHSGNHFLVWLAVLVSLWAQALPGLMRNSEI